MVGFREVVDRSGMGSVRRWPRVERKKVKGVRGMGRGLIRCEGRKARRDGGTVDGVRRKQRVTNGRVAERRIRCGVSRREVN